MEEQVFGPIISESDFQQDIQMIDNYESCFVEDNILVNEIRNFDMRVFIKFVYATRECNEVVRRLSKHAFDCK